MGDFVSAMCNFIGLHKFHIKAVHENFLQAHRPPNPQRAYKVHMYTYYIPHTA